MSEAPEEKWLAHNGGLPSGNYPQSEMVRYVRADVHEAAVAAARKEGIDSDLISEKRIKYEALAARISVGKASQQEACDAIMQLCRDNERLAVIAGRLRAEESK